MKKIHCDICGKEIKSDSPIVNVWDKNVFIDINEDFIEDVCEECYKIIYCCINMMKETKWRPDFHEISEFDSLWDRDVAEYKLHDLKEQTGLKF